MKIPLIQLLKTKTISQKRKSEDICFVQLAIKLFDSDFWRILIFGTEANVTKLKSNPHCYADGTFDAFPAFFTPVFTLHVVVGGYLVPMINLITCQKKTNRTYVKY